MGAEWSVVLTPLLEIATAELIRVLVEKVAAGPTHPAPMPGNIQNKSSQQLRAEAQEQLRIDSVNSYNFAFAGNSGTGKSSLINALRGVQYGLPGAAPVDEMECTEKITVYTHPQHHHIAFWDIPGGGTQGHCSTTYFSDHKLYAFDTIIILVAGRFTQLDLAIAQSAQKYNVPIVFVRSKSDVDTNNRSLRSNAPKKEAKHAIREDVIKDIRRQLPDILRDRQIYVLSAHTLSGHLDLHDYGLDEGMFVKYVTEVTINRRN